ncbi:MAG TPA: FtsX-like permease family protein, partial [Nocardioidaceae bacterium]|nr:FtsX-like permease family protein [Nocardioidaceae bacterium]
MWRLTLSQVLARRFRLAFTLLAVVLGVTFVTGSLVLTDTSQRLFDDQFRSAVAKVDLTVRDAVAFDAAMGVEVDRDPLPAGLTARIDGIEGVQDTRPVAKGQGLIVVDGEPVVPNGPTMLSSWSPAPFGAFVIREGEAPAGPGEVVVDAATADEHGIAIGDTVTVRSVRSESMRVVGLAGFDDRPGLPNTTVALTSLGTAQELLDLGNAVSEVLVIAGDVPVSQLRDRIGDGLGAAYEVSSSQDTAAASAEAAKTKLSYLQLMLFALAGAALLVGGFLIANTFSIVISQRTRELALLRAAGATGRQIVGSVLGEAAFVGVLASALGTVLGVAAAVGLRDLVGQFGVALPDGDVVVAPRTVIVACAVGVLVTLLSAAGPARRAARVAPVEAMRQSTVAATRISRARLLIGGAFAVLDTGAVVTVTLGNGPVALVGVGAVLGLTGLTLLAPVLTPGLARLVGRPLRSTGVTGRLATESAARAPRRTAATAMALALSLALITFMTVVASSIKGSIADSYREVISADYVVESARGEMLGGLSPEIYRDVSGLPEVEVASRLRYGHWKEGGATRALTAIDPQTLPAVTSVQMVAGSLDELDSGGIVLAEKVAVKQGLEIGDPFRMTFSRTGERRLPVVGLVADDDAQALMTDYLIS